MKAIVLNYPIDADGIKLEQIKMRRPKVRDMLMAEKQCDTAAEKEMLIFCNLCDVSTATMEEMDAKDYRALQVVYQGFFD